MSQQKIDRFTALHESAPDNPLHIFALAQACMEDERWEQAAASYERCLALDPQWMMATIRRGRCLIALERWAEAKTCLQRGADLAHQLGHDEPFDEIRELLDQLPDGVE